MTSLLEWFCLALALAAIIAAIRFEILSRWHESKWKDERCKRLWWMDEAHFLRAEIEQFHAGWNFPPSPMTYAEEA